MKRPARLIVTAIGVLILIFGLLCLNYTKADGLEHHKKSAQRLGLPPPSNAILYSGVASIVLGAGSLGYVLGASRRRHRTFS